MLFAFPTAAAYAWQYMQPCRMQAHNMERQKK